MLQSMGFTPDQAKFALKKNNGDTNLAANWLFTTSPEEVARLIAEDAVAEKSAASRPKPADFTDGKASYTLIGMVSHVGSNAQTGHYVCHLKKKDGFVIYNDEKVAKSKKPPLQNGYVYFYKR